MYLLSQPASSSSSLPPFLLDAIQAGKVDATARAFSPLFPAPPPAPAKSAPARQVDAYDSALAAGARFESELLAQAGSVRSYLGCTYAQICEEAALIPAFLRRVSRAAPSVLHMSKEYFGVTVPGRRSASECEQYLRAALRTSAVLPDRYYDIRPALDRAFDPLYWRRVLWRKAIQASESLHLRLKLVGSAKTRARSAYVSDSGLAVRRSQLSRLSAFVDTTTLTTVINGAPVSIPLAQVAKTSEQRMSRVYAFVRAMDALAVESHLEISMITATLPGAYHPNPPPPRRRRRPAHVWNGVSPEDAHRELGRRWQSIRRDLDDCGIKLSGFWAAEPHEDACPHRHFWAIYRPEHRSVVMSAFARYFPAQVVGSTVVPSVRLRHPVLGDLMFVDVAACITNTCTRTKPSKSAKPVNAPACVEFSVVDRRMGPSAGASYAYKYLFPDLGSVSGAAVDAHRAIWNIRSHQFFGVNNSLSLWDELRKLGTAPLHPDVLPLWVAARGGVREGRIGSIEETATDAQGVEVVRQVPEQRGDALTFLRLQGGLACLQVAPPRLKQKVAGGVRVSFMSVRLATSPVFSRYGELVRKVVGIEVVERIYSRTRREVIDTETGEISFFGYRYFYTIDLMHFISTRSLVWLKVVAPQKDNKIPPG